MIPFHRIYFDIQNSMNSIYSESRKKSRIAQMLLVSYRSRNKEFSLETAVRCHTVAHELCQRTKCSLCSLFIQLYARALNAVGLFSILSVCLILVLRIFVMLYVDIHRIHIFLLSILGVYPSRKTTILAQKVRSLVSGRPGFQKSSPTT